MRGCGVGRESPRRDVRGKACRACDLYFTQANPAAAACCKGAACLCIEMIAHNCCMRPPAVPSAPMLWEGHGKEDRLIGNPLTAASCAAVATLQRGLMASYTLLDVL